MSEIDTFQGICRRHPSTAVGNVWIYSIYQPNYNKNTTSVDPYCDKTLYLFAFWTTTLVYILLGLFLLCGCDVLVCFLLSGHADPNNDI